MRNYKKMERKQNGKCIAIKTWDYQPFDSGKRMNKPIRKWTEGELFNFWLEDGWLYHIENENNKQLVQYALFDNDFKIIDE